MSSIIAPEDVVLDRHRVLDCRGSEADYRAGHIRGAVHAQLDRDLSAPGDAARGGRHPLPPIEAWAATLGRWGIDPSTPVLLYDDKGGSNAAARAWWMLRASGHRDVAVLDGGFAAAKGVLPIDDEVIAVDPKPPYPVRAWTLPLRDIEDVAELREGERLIDVRAPERYRGESETLDPIAGHIPGAHNVPLTESLRPDGRFKSAAELRAHFEEKLGVPIENVIVSCGSGVTACHTLLALDHAGMPGAALYVGSWSEWCRSDREKKTGPAP